jgi:hypothetical protein
MTFASRVARGQLAMSLSRSSPERKGGLGPRFLVRIAIVIVLLDCKVYSESRRVQRAVMTHGMLPVWWLSGRIQPSAHRGLRRQWNRGLSF